MAKKQKYYVVWKGRIPGIFPTWKACAAQVSGIRNAEYKAFDTYAAAQQAFQNSYEDYKGKPLITLSLEALRLIGQPNLDSYTVDASCRGYPGPVEYRCVNTRTQVELFREGPFENGTNNIGEFLGIVHALELFQKEGIRLPVYSDSAIAIGWVKQTKCKTQLLRDDSNRKLFTLIEWAEAWLAKSAYPNEILKWETEAWGENPADFGRK